MDELEAIGTIGYDLLNSSYIMVHIPMKGPPQTQFFTNQQYQ